MRGERSYTPSWTELFLLAAITLLFLATSRRFNRAEDRIQALEEAQLAEPVERLPSVWAPQRETKSGRVVR